MASEEKNIGADIVIHVSIKTSTYKYSKGALVQAKRVERHKNMDTKFHKLLFGQCQKMLKITPASFVFDYTKAGMRCGSASRIAGTSNRNLYEECIWTPYRFFLEFFRCPIGDPRLTSALVRDLPVPILLNIKAVGD